MYKEHMIYVGITLHEGIKAKDISFRISDNHKDSFLVIRDGWGDGHDKVDHTKTFVLNKIKNKKTLDNYDMVLGIGVPIIEELSSDDLTFCVKRSGLDGFEIHVDKKPVHMKDEEVFDEDEVYIAEIYMNKSKKLENKFFVFTFKGEYREGQGYVVAPTHDIAYQEALDELERNNVVLTSDLKRDEVVEVDLKKEPHAEITFDGQYS